MKRKAGWINSTIYAGTYLYLALPVIIFCIGWCRWYYGIPAAAAIAAAVICCIREYRGGMQKTFVLEKEDWIRAAAVVLLVLLWVGLSGVGGYVWQNTDHAYRNEMFALLAEEEWPLRKEAAAGSQLPGRGIVYYIGSWLPAAVAGKMFGFSAGRAALYLWTSAGILLMYGQICIWRKKISVWPLVLLIFFSAPDALGTLLGTADTLQVFGDQHLEWWPQYYQFSSITTQLFWVYNQAVPAWLLFALVFLDEKPGNMIFLSSLLMLTSTLPFLGLLPYLVYFMIKRSVWRSFSSVRQLLAQCWYNWSSIQNVLGGGAAASISIIYLSGNDSLRESMQILNSEHRVWIFLGGMVFAAAVFYAAVVLVRKGCGRRLRQLAAVAGTAAVILRIIQLSDVQRQSPMFYWINLTFFYAVEAGVCLYALYPAVEDKKLFMLNSIWLYVIPLVMVGHSIDFCMRASIPGLFLMTLWCIWAADTRIWKKHFCRAVLLAVFLAAGAVTPLHEMKRSFVNTRNYYENAAVDEDSIFTGRNFSGSTKGVFWRCVAKQK